MKEFNLHSAKFTQVLLDVDFANSPLESVIEGLGKHGEVTVRDNGSFQVDLPIDEYEWKRMDVAARLSGMCPEAWYSLGVADGINKCAGRNDDEKEEFRLDFLEAEIAKIDAEEREYKAERARLQAAADMKPELFAGDRAKAGYLAVIAALARALADAVPALQKDGAPLVGYSGPTGDRGIVGHLLAGGYTTRSERDVRDKLSAALKLKE